MSNHGCKSRRDGWWDLKSRCTIKSMTSLVWTSKTFYESEMALLSASTPKCRYKTLDRA